MTKTFEQISFRCKKLASYPCRL